MKAIIEKYLKCQVSHEIYIFFMLLIINELKTYHIIKTISITPI